MKDKFLTVLLLSVFFTTGALAGKGGPLVTGTWTGTGQAIYMDGTEATIIVDFAHLNQTEDNFVYGNSQFRVTVGNNPKQTLPGQISGYIQGNILKGAFGGCAGPAPNCIGAVVFEGKLSGNTLSGTVIDLSDGSTGVVTLERTTD